MDFISRVNTRLLCLTYSTYQISNCLHFMDKCQMLPLSFGQKQDILKFLKTVSKNKEDQALAVRAGRFVREFELRDRHDLKFPNPAASNSMQMFEKKKPQAVVIDLDDEIEQPPPPKRRYQRDEDDGY